MGIEANRSRQAHAAADGDLAAKFPRPDETSGPATAILDEVRELERAMCRNLNAADLAVLRGELALAFGVRERELDHVHQEALDKFDLERVRRGDRRAGVHGWITIAYRAIGVAGAGVVVADMAGLLHPSTGLGALVRWLTGAG